MDLLEKVFEKYWRVRGKRGPPPHSAELDQIREYLEVVSGFVYPKGGRLQVNEGLHFAGVWEQTLILPSRISLFSQWELNRAAYLSLALRSCMAARLEISGSSKLVSRNAQRLEYLAVSPKINRSLDALFPGFRGLDENLMRASDLGNNAWIQALYCRDEAILREIDLPDPADSKSGDRLKPWVHALIPCLPQHLPQSTHSPDTDESTPSSPSRGSQQENKKGEIVRRVDLEKEKKDSNPVTHSFEKLETADDYSGGHRTEDGDDALENHSAALEEVEFSQVALSGTPTHSVYQSNQASAPNRPLDVPGTLIVEQKRYAEWSESKHAYLADFCLLSVTTPTLSSPTTQGPPSAREDLARHYARELPTWRSQVAQLFNEPLWIKRQLEGSEIDLDASVRYLTDLRVGEPGPQRLYAHKRVSEQSLAIQILFDQSLSTDAWVKNRRVIDLTLEAIGLCGILFDGILPHIQIAGTWSATRHNCRIQIYKGPNDSWDSYFRHSAEIAPQGYTRLGPSIRYSADILKQQSSRRKVLLLVTDGKPSDLDPYEGFHGIHDVRKACLEAEAFGIHTVALAIDQRHRSHFSVMFKNPIVLTDPSLLPAQLIRTLMHIIRR